MRMVVYGSGYFWDMLKGICSKDHYVGYNTVEEDNKIYAGSINTYIDTMFLFKVYKVDPRTKFRIHPEPISQFGVDYKLVNEAWKNLNVVRLNKKNEYILYIEGDLEGGIVRFYSDVAGKEVPYTEDDVDILKANYRPIQLSEMVESVVDGSYLYSIIKNIKFTKYDILVLGSVNHKGFVYVFNIKGEGTLLYKDTFDYDGSDFVMYSNEHFTGQCIKRMLHYFDRVVVKFRRFDMYPFDYPVIYELPYADIYLAPSGLKWIFPDYMSLDELFEKY